MLSCAVGVLGLVIFANAPDVASAVAGSLLVSGVARPIIRAAGVIWINRRATSAVRATVHSLLSQAEHAGVIILGVTLAVVAGAASTTVTLVGSAALLACAGALVAVTCEDVPQRLSARRHR